MTNLEHLIENTLGDMEEYKGMAYENILNKIKSDINYEQAGITAEQCFEICLYVYYTYRPSILEDTENEGHWDNYDWCYECRGYGDDVTIDENGEPINNCTNCVHNPCKREVN